MGATSLDTSPDEEAFVCGPGIDTDISVSFPEGFFINPFAVSFPGDLPCSTPIAMERDVPPTFLSPSRAVSHPHPVQDGRVEKFRPTSSNSKASTNVSSPLHGLEHKATASKTEDKKSSNASTKANAKPSTKYGPEIHFVDMTNKKEAQRIRNTMNSRKHRQNKLEKIRELESKLAALEDEKSTWHDRAKELGGKK